MSIKTSYLPTTDANKVVWFNNFSSKIGTYASAVGITATEVTGIHNDAAYFQFIVNMSDTFRQFGNNITAYKSMLKHAVDQQHIGALPVVPVLGTPPAAVSEGAFDRVAKYVQRIKASANYTDSMGQDLGIIAAQTVTNINTLQPDLTVKLDAGRPHIKCTKGMSDAVDLYVDRRDGSGFVLVARLLRPDYIDTANLPAGTAIAEWDYKAIYVIGNDPVGVMSPVVSVMVKRQ